MASIFLGIVLDIISSVKEFLSFLAFSLTFLTGKNCKEVSPTNMLLGRGKKGITPYNDGKTGFIMVNIREEKENH